MSDPSNKFGSELKRYRLRYLVMDKRRKEKRLSQDGLKYLMRVKFKMPDGFSALDKVERGERSPSPELIAQIAIALGLSTSEEQNLVDARLGDLVLNYQRKYEETRIVLRNKYS